MQPTTSKEIHKALARRLANRDLSDDVLKAVSTRLVRDGLKIGGVDFCPYGICIDYFADHRISIDALLKTVDYRAVRMFPYGLLDEDLIRVQIEMNVPEIAGFSVR